MPKTIGSLCGLLLLVSCSSPAGPVVPEVVDSPRTPVVIDSTMADWLAVPNANQAYGWTDDGLLTYTFQLQNRTNETFFVQVKSTFFDESGVNVVDDQLPKRQSIPSAGIVSVRAVAINPAARKVRVQILRVH